jgi:TetR/AcrR family transcriptional regulator, transcriptional repressor for nem operon
MDTRERILETAQRLAQQRGFNAFSYADISAAVGVRKASIHHHFASKEDLELELVRRYRQDFNAKLEAIETRQPRAAERIREYGRLYMGTLAAGGICMCGMMASDIASLSPALREPLRVFFEDQVRWLTAILNRGREAGELSFADAPGRRALSILADLQGGLVIAHALQDPAVLESLLDTILAGLRPQ